MSCASSVATRGIMYSIYPRPVATGNKWHPLHKPQWLEVNRSYHDNCAAVRGVFLHLNISLHGNYIIMSIFIFQILYMQIFNTVMMYCVAHLWTPVELQTEILPYTGVMSAVTLKNPAQVSLLQTLTQFTTGTHHNR